MKFNISFLTSILLPALVAANSSTPSTPSSAIEYQQTTNSRIVVEENFLRFFTGGEERITLDGNGNVGIGTTTPDQKLEVKGRIRAERLVSPKTRNLIIQGHDAGGGIGYGVEMYAVENGFNFKTFSGSWGSRLAIHDNGNVGIGTTDPDSKLQIDVVEGIPLKINTPDASMYFHHHALTLKSDPSFSYVPYIQWLAPNGNRQAYLGWEKDYFNLRLENGYDFGILGGAVGIGTNDPSRLFEVRGSSPVMSLRNTADGVGAYGWIEFNDSNSRMGYLGFGSSGNNHIYLTNEVGGNILIPYGNVGIGTTSPSYKLHVAGKVKGTHFHGDKYYAGGIQVWPDFVFEETYELDDLKKVEKFIEKNHRLPEIPSATEVESNGIDIVDMQAKLLQKIEELTLYVIEQQKEMEELKSQNQTQQKEIDKLKSKTNSK